MLPADLLEAHGATERGLSESKIAQLAAWPTSGVFSAKDRSCLAFAEQLTIDVTGVTPQLVRDVYEHFSESDGFGFIASVAVIEQELRLSLTLERLLG